jgi:ankyrin repeat protein
MKNVLVALGVCLYLVPVVFAQCFFELVKTGTPEHVRAALANGAKFDHRDKDGWTPLMVAARNNPNPEVITVLLKSGAIAKLKSKEGKTAFA